MLVYQRVYHVLGGYLFTSYWRILSRVLGNIWKYWTTAAWFVSDHFHRDIISGNYDIHHGILGAYGSILFSDQLTHSTNRKIICILVANKHWMVFQNTNKHDDFHWWSQAACRGRQEFSRICCFDEISKNWLGDVEDMKTNPWQCEKYCLVPSGKLTLCELENHHL